MAVDDSLALVRNVFDRLDHLHRRLPHYRTMSWTEMLDWVSKQAAELGASAQ